MSRKEPKSKLLLSVCKDLQTRQNHIVHLNASISDIDWIMSELQRQRDNLVRMSITGSIDNTINKYVR